MSAFDFPWQIEETLDRLTVAAFATFREKLA